MMKFAKYLAWLLLVVGVLQIFSALTQPGPRYIERAIYCDYFAGGWHCHDTPQTLAVDTSTWARYMLPFDVGLMLIAGMMLYGASRVSKRFVWAAFAALVVLFVAQSNYTPRVYVNRQAEKPVSEPQSEDMPQKVQTASVTVWTRPDTNPATAHAEMYPEENSVLYLAYKNAVVFPGFDSALAMQTGQYSVVNEGGFPIRHSSTAPYILYDVRTGWSHYSNQTKLGRVIVQHFCQDEHMAIYEVVDPQNADYLKGPELANMVSVCGRSVDETQVPASTSAASPSISTSVQTSPPVRPPTDPNGKSLPDNSGDVRTNFTARGPDGEYAFIWGHALHEFTEPPAYSMGKVDPNADPDAELPTMHLETYLLRRPQSEQKGVFIFEFGEYEALKPEQKATVQGFCNERIRILHKAWPNVDEHDWRQGGWYELNAPPPKGNLSPVCN